MALTFPRNMPSRGAVAQRFEIFRVDYATPETGGRVQSVTAGFPLWRMTLELGEMGPADGDAWSAFVASLRGVGRTFLARDLVHAFPRAYPRGFTGVNRAGGGAFGPLGAATSWSVNGTRDVLTLGGLPANLPIVEGDMIGFAWVTAGVQRRTMARAVESVVASGAGAASVQIEPPLPTLVPGGATARLGQPEAVMRLVREETALGSEDAIGLHGGTIVGLQDLRA